MPEVSSPASSPSGSGATEFGPLRDRLRSLADETRGRILLLLERSELTVGEVCQVVQLPQSTVSRHLGALAGEGWLRVRVDGPSRHYRFANALDPAGRALWEAVRSELAGTAAAGEDRARAAIVNRARAERAQAFFASEATRWEPLKGRLFGERAELQLLPALLTGEEVVGDLGCGTGRLLECLAPFAREAIGVDRSEAMLGLARERLAGVPGVRLEAGELECLPIADGALDLAILSLVLHYVAEPERVLAEVHRVLRPGGRLLLLDMQEHDRTGLREEMGHLWLGFSRDRLERALAAAGFGGLCWSALPPDPSVEGPRLFVLRARARSGPAAPTHPIPATGIANEG